MHNLFSALSWLVVGLVGDPECRDTTVWLRADAAPHGTPTQARELATWLTGADLDQELLSPTAIGALNVRNRATVGAWRDPLAPPSPLDQDRVDAELRERLDAMAPRVASGELLPSPGAPRGDPFADVVARTLDATHADRLHALVEPADLRCLPTTTGLFRDRIDPAFDRNQCSRLHPGDLVRVLRETDGWLYVRAGHGVGWLHRPTLTPPLGRAERALLAGPRVTVSDDLVPAWTTHGDLHLLRLGATFPAVPDPDQPLGLRLLIPTLEGWIDAFPAAGGLVPASPSLTRRQVLTLLFARLMDPYGWGGTYGFRDCSALLLDTLAVFDLRLGRHSSVQAQAGSEAIDTSAMSPTAKLDTIRAAHARGLVFLYMPGHIMVYLGPLPSGPAPRDPSGAHDFAISAISEYLLPCPEGGHQTVRIDRVDVTDLARGEGTSRTSFLSRITRISVFGARSP